MQTVEVTVNYKKGIHARPAAIIVKTASAYTSSISIGVSRSELVNAKSIIGILTLGATYGTRLIIIATGEDENVAVAALQEVFANSAV